MPSASRSSISVSFRRLGVGVALLAATGCGGEAKGELGTPAGSSQAGAAGTAGGSSAVGGSAGVGGAAASAGVGGAAGSAGSTAAAGSACGSPLSTPVGRPTASACTATSFPTPNPNAPACTGDGDCADAGAASYCLGDQCGLDQCLVDSDCPSGQACRCANQQGGNALHRNSCVPTGCRVDADCGPGGTCSPDISGFCSSLTGYQCHSSLDTCHSDADCCDNTPDTPPDARRRCGYQPELGHWACAALLLCNG
jgi:hypothetical protein